MVTRSGHPHDHVFRWHLTTTFRQQARPHLLELLPPLRSFHFSILHFYFILALIVTSPSVPSLLSYLHRITYSPPATSLSSLYQKAFTTRRTDHTKFFPRPSPLLTPPHMCTRACHHRHVSIYLGVKWITYPLVFLDLGVKFLISTSSRFTSSRTLYSPMLPIVLILGARRTYYFLSVSFFWIPTVYQVSPCVPTLFSIALPWPTYSLRISAYSCFGGCVLFLDTVSVSSFPLHPTSPGDSEYDVHHTRHDHLVHNSLV